MGNLLAYSGTTTKIRAMKSLLLNMDNYAEMAALNNVTEVLDYLHNQPAYHDILGNIDKAFAHRGEIEKLLTNSVYQDFQKIYRFSSNMQRRFLDLYFHRYEVSVLKTCIRMIFDHRDVVLDLHIFEDFWAKHSDIDLAELTNSRTTSEFVANLRGSIYYSALQRLTLLAQPTLWDYEMAIDLFYFRWFWKKGDKLLDKSQKYHFKESYGAKMDLLNVNWIYRSKYYFNMEGTDIYAHLISVLYHLKQGEITALVEAENKEEFNRILKSTYYGRRYPDYAIDTLESSYSLIRQNIQHKAAKGDPYSTATVIAYLFEKEHEIDKITTILEGVRYGLTKNQIMEYINH